MNYVIGYFAVGIVVLVVTVGSHLLGQRKESGLERMMRDFDARRKTWGDRAIEWIVAPIAAVVGWPALVYMGAKNWWSGRKELPPDEEREFAVTRNHLLERRTVEEIETAERIRDPLGAVPDLAFGHLNAGWEKFRENLHPDDELWSFRSPWRDWRGKEVREGYAIVRSRKIGPWFIADRRPLNDPGD